VSDVEFYRAQAWDNPSEYVALAVVSDGKGRKFVGSWPITRHTDEEYAKRAAEDLARTRMIAAKVTA
jgi:hypothetical protein